MLGVLTQQQLKHAFFPLGDTVKTEIRAEAERRGLSVAAKPDSHDICFIADGNTPGFLAEQLGEAPGDIVDSSGDKLGEHSGTHGFTVGQRKGLRIGTPAADGKPRFVLDISPVDRTVTVGLARGAGGARAWSRPSRAGAVRSRPETLQVKAQLRAHGDEVAVTARVDGNQVYVDFDEATAAVAPGQAVVLYDGTRVIGSATIDSVQPRRGATSHDDYRPGVAAR